jgi:hypothetical protein
VNKKGCREIKNNMTTNDCKRCKERGKVWNGADPRCAFETGAFSSNNWNCATMNDLRDKVVNICRNDEQRAGLICGVDSLHVFLSWYKERDATEMALMMTIDGKAVPLSLAEAERILDRRS